MFQFISRVDCPFVEEEHFEKSHLSPGKGDRFTFGLAALCMCARHLIHYANGLSGPNVGSYGKSMSLAFNKIIQVP